MKKQMFACAFVLGASMFVSAQQAPPASTPPTFPSDQSQQAPTQTPRADTMPQDTTAPPATPQSTVPDASASSASSTQSDQSSSSGKAQSIQGCISQDTGMGGGYVLTDAAGTKYALSGDSSKFSSYVGQEVKVKGMAGSASSSMSSSQSSSADQSASSTASSAKPDQSSSTSSQAPGASSSASTQIPLTVDSVKKVADTCSNAPAAK